MRRAASIAALAALAAALAAAPSPAPAADPQASLADIEDEVMCPICGTLLELSESPQAQRQKVFISGLIAEGKTKEEIKDELVAQYGQEVLALPRGSGFSLSAYLVPVLAFLAAVAALAVGIARRRRVSPSNSPPSPASAGPSEEQAQRLEADLSRYDL